MLTIKCRCCGQDVAIDLQERQAIIINGVMKRPAKTPLLLITCRNPECPVKDATFAVETIIDYEVREDVRNWR